MAPSQPSIRGLDIQLKRKPFEDVFVVGNQNKIGNFNKITDLTESLPNLFVNTASLANDLLRKEDNIKGDALPFKGKESFLKGLGGAEIVYNSHETRRHLALRFATLGFDELLKEVDQGEIKMIASNFADRHFLNQEGFEGGILKHILSSSRYENFNVRLLEEDLEGDDTPSDILEPLRDSIKDEDYFKMATTGDEIVAKLKADLARLNVEFPGMCLSTRKLL